MTTGIIVSGGGDLDVLFKARATAAAANTGYLSNGGVDIAQRFEARGGTTAIANVNYKSNGGVDLAQTFMGIAVAGVNITRTMTVGTTGTPAFDLGYRNTASSYVALTGQAMSSTPEWTKSAVLYRLDQWIFDQTSDTTDIRVSNATTTPVDTDAVWEWMALTGIFSNSSGLSVRRVYTRISRSVTNTHTTPSGRPGRSWQGIGGVSGRIVNGNAYTLEIA